MAETLFEDFVKTIETAVDAVAMQVPYTKEQVVSIAFMSVENSDIYYDGVKEWRRKDTADKTWDAFKTFFAREFREIRVLPRTSAPEGYGSHCTRVGHANYALLEEMQQQQEEALENLVTSTVADWQAVTSLSSRNATLINELRAATATIATLQQRLEICSCSTTPPTGAGGQQHQEMIQKRQHNPVRDATPLGPNG